MGNHKTKERTSRQAKSEEAKSRIGCSNNRGLRQSNENATKSTAFIYAPHTDLIQLQSTTITAFKQHHPMRTEEHSAALMLTTTSGSCIASHRITSHATPRVDSSFAKNCSSLDQLRATRPLTTPHCKLNSAAHPLTTLQRKEEEDRRRQDIQ